MCALLCRWEKPQPGAMGRTGQAGRHRAWEQSEQCVSCFRKAHLCIFRKDMTMGLMATVRGLQTSHPTPNLPLYMLPKPLFSSSFFRPLNYSEFCHGGEERGWGGQAGGGRAAIPCCHCGSKLESWKGCQGHGNQMPTSPPGSSVKARPSRGGLSLSLSEFGDCTHLPRSPAPRVKKFLLMMWFKHILFT